MSQRKLEEVLSIMQTTLHSEELMIFLDSSPNVNCMETFDESEIAINLSHKSKNSEICLMEKLLRFFKSCVYPHPHKSYKFMASRIIANITTFDPSTSFTGNHNALTYVLHSFHETIIEKLEFLIQNLIHIGCDVNHQVWNSKQFMTPIRYVMDKFYLKLYFTRFFMILVKAGANINIQFENGNSILHEFARCNCEPQLVELFTTNKSGLEQFLNVKNDDNQTPCELAHACGHTGIARILETMKSLEDTIFLDFYKSELLLRFPNDLVNLIATFL